MSQAGSSPAPQTRDDAHDHDHDHDHGGSGHKHSHHIQTASCCEMHNTSSSEGSIVFALVGGAMVFTTVLARWMGLDQEVSVIPAAIGAVLLWRLQELPTHVVPPWRRKNGEENAEAR